MELIFRQQITIFDSKPTTEDIIGKMNELLDEDYYFCHFIADGIEVRENHEDYLNQNLNEIKRIEILAKTVKEFVNDILLSAEDYIKRATPDLGTLAEEFYDIPTPETWGRFSELIEGLQWVNDMLSLIIESTVKPSNWEKYVQVSTEMQEALKNLEQALENGDHVLIGDLIQYEIIMNFNTLGEEIQKSIDTEGIRHDLN